ncbi:hypothetical protein TEQG_01944 [Trichophyton equinum CBS 127.97]|uniref:Uncharacterized protein n=1 Tax=Trichophyton equinum (strain ATCC MYA-4606 / CBS 127.97) TaxID=559882 RepID=F2PLY8_TRIEC|nr:hypothetical protein TEQG_01944 [Trichophyton equinum CBS 127.97]
MVSDTSSTSDSSSERGYSRRHKKRHRIRKGDRRRQPATNTDRTLDMLILVFVEHMKVEIENAKMRLSKAKESQSRKEKWTPPLQSRRKRVYVPTKRATVIRPILKPSPRCMNITAHQVEDLDIDG